MKITDLELLKHYVGTNVTICFQQKEEEFTITGKLVCYDSEEATIKLKESILYEIGLEKIEHYSVKGFDQLTENDCMNIVKAVHGFHDGWAVKAIDGDQIVLSNIHEQTKLVDYRNNIILTRNDHNYISVSIFSDSRLPNKQHTGIVYSKLFSMGFAIA